MDGLFDGYLDWRQRGGDPLSKDELEGAAKWLLSMLGNDHRLVALVQSRTRLGVERTVPATKASRGGLVELSQMSFSEALNHARERVNAGALEASLPLYRRALEVEPGNQLATADLANALLALDRLDEAVDVVELSVAAHPGDLDAKVQAAGVYVRTNRVEEGVRLCNEVLAVDPRHYTAHHMLGNLCEFQNEPQKAVTYYQRAIEISPTRWESAYRLALILGQDQATVQVARRVLDQAIHYNPERVDLRELRAQLQ
jgi:tetratricopeptide (TPR) repeat protein